MKLKFDVGEKKQIAGLQYIHLLGVISLEARRPFPLWWGSRFKTNQTHTNCT